MFKLKERVVGDMLRMYIGEIKQSWDKWLYLCKFTYNQRLYNSIGGSPFFALKKKIVSASGTKNCAQGLDSP